MAQADIKSLSLDELTDEMAVLGLPKYRAEQIFEWLHRKSVCTFDEMSNISKTVREELSNLYYISVEILKKNRFPVMMKR